MAYNINLNSSSSVLKYYVFLFKKLSISIDLNVYRTNNDVKILNRYDQ